MLCIDDYMERIENRSRDAIDVACSLKLDNDQSKTVYVAALAFIADAIANLRQQDDKKDTLQPVRPVDFSEHSAELSWNILTYDTPENGLKHRLFLASGIDWSNGSVSFSVREGFFTGRNEKPIAVSRLRYTFTNSQIEVFLKTRAGKKKLFTDYCKVYGCTVDEFDNLVLRFVDFGCIPACDEKSRSFAEHFLEML